jgi:UDP-glucose 4-epimerase
MRVLVTGAYGNIGSHTVPELMRRGHQVRVFNRLSTAARKKAAGLKVETIWGNVTDRAALERATAGMDTVIHLAAKIPPGADEHPDEARATNVDGTANVIAACHEQPAPPRLLFTSTFDVHGHTLHKPPPRHVDDPLEATDPYTEHKIECEALVQASGLDWCILRLADVPMLAPRDPHPIMFEIGLDNRIETLHADDAALALANALETPAVWGRILFVGGGPSCQVTYREYLTRLLAAMGVEPLPDQAFSTKVYATDWLDTEESEALLHYQRHTFDEIAEAVAAAHGWRRRVASAAGPLARAAILRLSPYYKASR